MLGYWNQPEETATAIRDGRMHSGDLATSDRQGRVQGRRPRVDLHRLRTATGAWSTPQRLPEALNSAADVTAIRLSPDERTLYFAHDNSIWSGSFTAAREAAESGERANLETSGLSVDIEVPRHRDDVALDNLPGCSLPKWPSASARKASAEAETSIQLRETLLEGDDVFRVGRLQLALVGFVDVGDRAGYQCLSTGAPACRAPHANSQRSRQRRPTTTASPA